MNCEQSLKYLFKSRNEESGFIVEDIKLHYILKIRTCCGINDYFVIKNKEKYKLYDLYNQDIPNEIMIEVKENEEVYYKRVENIEVSDINEFKNLYPIVDIIDLKQVNGLDFKNFLQIIKNKNNKIK